MAAIILTLEVKPHHKASPHSSAYQLKSLDINDATQNKGLDWPLFKRFLVSYVWPYRARMAVIALCMMAYAGTVAALPWLFENLVNKVLVNKDIAALGSMSGAVLIIFSVRAVASFGQRYLLGQTSFDLVVDMQKDMSGHMLNLDFGFFQTNTVGQLIARVVDDVQQLQSVGTNVLINLTRDLVTMVGLIGYVLYTNASWFGIALIAGPLIALPAILANRRLRRLSHQAQQNKGDIISAFEEGFHGIRGIKSEGNEKLEMRRLSGVLGLQRTFNRRLVRTGAFMTPIVDIVTGITLVGVLWFGGRDVIAGNTEAGQLMGFVGALMLLYEPLKRLVQINTQLQRANASLMRIYQVFDLEPTIKESPDAAPLNNPKGDVVFNNVAFSYDDFAVLKGFNATIKSGQAVAFVGPSGGGKSTLFSLLPRLYDLNGGSITIGGQDIRQVRLSDLRQSIAVVTQDILLFDAALKDNLGYGTELNGSDLDYTMALSVAQASDFASSLEHGLDYKVGPRGSKLSGGQKQRIAVARAILRDAPILLLDEATANLDAETERLITKSLLAARKGKTTLIVAHRQASIVDVDQIFVVENGVVAEHGTHEELSHANGVYANLFATAEVV